MLKCSKKFKAMLLNPCRPDDDQCKVPDFFQTGKVPGLQYPGVNSWYLQAGRSAYAPIWSVCGK